MCECRGVSCNDKKSRHLGFSPRRRFSILWEKTFLRIGSFGGRLWDSSAFPLRLFPSYQFPPDGTHHRNEAGAAADDVGNGFGEEHARHAQSADTRQNVHQRNHNDRLTKQGEENGLFGTAQRQEGDLPGHLKRHHEKTTGVNPYASRAGLD